MRRVCHCLRELPTSRELATAAAAGGEPWLSVLTAEQVVPKLLALGFSSASVESGASMTLPGDAITGASHRPSAASCAGSR